MPAKLTTNCAILLAMLAAASGTAVGDAQGSAGLQRVEIIDRNGFERPMTASTVLVPAGWPTRGGVVWNTQALCGGAGYNVDFRATAPDGRAEVHFLPMENWQWNSMGAPAMSGCRQARIASIRQYLEDFVQRQRPGARVLDYRPRPDLAEPLQQLAQSSPMPMGDMRTWVEGGELLIAYDLNGVDTRETIANAAVFNLMRTDGMMGMPGTEVLTGSTLPGFAMRAPNGQLDFNLAETIRSSAEANPAWEQRIAKHNTAIARTNLEGARKRAQITARTNEEIRQMQADSWRRSNESSDYLAREGSEAIRGVETYTDRYGETVELDNTYNNAWQLDDGDYIMTNDPDFNPYATFGQGAERLEVTP